MHRGMNRCVERRKEPGTRKGGGEITCVYQSRASAVLVQQGQRQGRKTCTGPFADEVTFFNRMQGFTPALHHTRGVIIPAKLVTRNEVCI